MEYSLHIENGMTPQTIPLDQLAEYMTALAELLGEKSHVHLHEVREGCVAIAVEVDDAGAEKVDIRLESIIQSQSSTDIGRAYKRLDELLRKHNASGTLRNNNDVVVIPFPGVTAPRPITFGPIKQNGSIAGELVRIGGTDETIHLMLRDGNVTISNLSTSKAIARELAKKLFNGTIRVKGEGTWSRGEDGQWCLDRFKVTDFEELDDTPLAVTVATLRAVEGSEWRAVPDPVSELLADRRADGEAH